MASHEVVYLTLEYISIILFIYLIGHCAYRSINYTLQIFCFVAILNNLNETFLLFKYDERAMTRARNTTACAVSAILENYLPLVLTLLASCVGFHIFFVIVCKSNKIERQLLKWYCLVSFGVPLVTTTIACILLRNKPYLSAHPRRYYCDLHEGYITFGTFAIPAILGALPGIVCSVCTAVVLVRHYFSFRQTLNRGTSTNSNLAFELSHCVRLFIFSLGFGILVLMATLERITKIKGAQTHDDTDAENQLAYISDFSGSFVGIVIFFIFGTTRDSMRTLSRLFCFCWPCCASPPIGTASNQVDTELAESVSRPSTCLSPFRPQSRSPLVRSPVIASNPSNHRVSYDLGAEVVSMQEILDAGRPDGGPRSWLAGS